MADPEKKRRLDEIKRKRRELMEQLNSSEAKKSKDAKTAEQEAREVLQNVRSKTSLDTKGVESQTDSILNLFIKQKKRDFKTVNFRETFPPSKPEMYDEYTQYHDDQKDDEDNSDNEEKEKIATKPRQQFIFQKNKKIKGEENELLKEKTYEVIPAEQREEQYKSSKEEIIEFLAKNKKPLVRAINEHNVYELFKKDISEDENVIENSNNLLHNIFDFYDEKCTKRAVTSLEWSLKYPELLLSSYSKRTDGFTSSQQNGLIMIWSLSLRKVPEYTFTCQSEITSAIFHSYNPKYIIGGTESGQVLIWDTRGKEAPVYKTLLGFGTGQSGTKTHSSCISCLGVIGSTNASNIMSISNGAICLWSLNNFSNPIKRIELKANTNDKKDKDDLAELGVLSLGMQQYETNNILLGSDDNKIYQINLNSGDYGGKKLTSFIGHEGPVYSIDFHPPDPFNSCNFAHLFSSTSADWTTRVWSRQKPEGPIFTLENSDNYVYCSKWCPTNPSILAYGDGDGYLDVMNFNKDLESPIVHCKMGDDAINNICWTEDGKRLAVGDFSGKIQLLGMDKSIYETTNDEAKKFEKIINHYISVK